MTTLSDDFNRANNTDVSTGGTVTYTEFRGGWSIVSNRLSLDSVTGIGILRADDALSTDDNYAQITAPSTGTSGGVYGVGCRWDAAAETGYAFLWRNATSSYTIFKAVAGTYTILVAASPTGRAAGDIIKVEANGTTINGYINGTKVATTTDSSITAGKHGVVISADTTIDFDDFEAADIGAAADALTATDFDAGKVIQRAPGSTSKTVTFAGTYTGTAPTTVEVKLVKASDSTLVKDWTELSSASISGGAWSGDLSVPQGGWYHFLARGVDADGTTVLATSSESANKWGVGINILTAGQSNMSNMFDRTSGQAASHDLTRQYKSSTWQAVAGTGAVRLANQIRAGLAGTGEAGTDIPIGLLNNAVSGSGMASDNGFGYWMDTSAGSPYKLAQAALQAVDAELVLWHQGETSAIKNDGKTTYKTDLGTLYTNFQTDTGRTAAQLPFGVGILGNIDNATATDATTDAIRQAQLEFVRDTTGAFFAGSSVDMVRAAADNFHWSATNEPYYARMGSRYAQAVLHQLGVETTGSEGLTIASASRNSGSADITLALTQHGGTAIEEADGTTDGGSLTGFQVSDDDFATTLTISSTAISSGNVVLTLSAAPADADTIKVRYQYGENPSITNVVYDDQTPQSDTLGFPLQPTIGSVTASLVAASVAYTQLERGVRGLNRGLVA